ncbi:MAG: 4Fe-4S double cluster binding domain-containing protein [Promethearchaeota archaeon]
MDDFCERCNRCVQLCPVSAILEKPIIKENGIISRIDGDKCMEVFYKTGGCSICLQSCPFHKIGYKAMYFARL